MCAFCFIASLLKVLSTWNWTNPTFISDLLYCLNQVPPYMTQHTHAISAQIHTTSAALNTGIGLSASSNQSHAPLRALIQVKGPAYHHGGWQYHCHSSGHLSKWQLLSASIACSSEKEIQYGVLLIQELRWFRIIIIQSILLFTFAKQYCNEFHLLFLI